MFSFANLTCFLFYASFGNMVIRYEFKAGVAQPVVEDELSSLVQFHVDEAGALVK